MVDKEKETTLNFIEDYKNFPQLWDQNDKFYTNKKKRNDGLQVLASKYNMDIDGVKKKIKSLRSYFSKEHQRVLKIRSGAGSDELYFSPWFGYKHLLFTIESMTPREITETSNQDGKDAGCTFNGESSATSQSTYKSEDEHEFTLPQIRKKRNMKSTKFDGKEEEANKIMKRTNEALTQKDEFTIYGQLIAHKIRNLNSFNRLIAQQRINNILFDLEMEQLTGAAATQNVTDMWNATEMRNDTDIPNDAEDVKMIL